MYPSPEPASATLLTSCAAGACRVRGTGEGSAPGPSPPSAKLLKANSGLFSDLELSPGVPSVSSDLSRAFSKSPFLGAGGSSGTPCLPLALAAPHKTVALFHSLAWSWILPIALSVFSPSESLSVSLMTLRAVLMVPRIVSLTWPISPAASSHHPAAVVNCCSWASMAFVCVSTLVLAAVADTPAHVFSLFKYDWSDCHPSLA